MMDNSLQKHHQNCSFSSKKRFGQDRKAVRVHMSKKMSGQVAEGKSSLVTAAVLPRMRKDDIYQIVVGDKLILELGEVWMIKSYDNKLKRCKTASFRMRLCARLLNAVRTKAGVEDLSMVDMINPSLFDDIVDATMTLCESDSSFTLKTPSVALKIGYDLGRLVGLKICHCIKNGDEEGESVARKFAEIMKINWSVKVSKFAHIAVNEKHFNNRKQLPHPQDIQAVAENLQKRLQNLDLETPDRYHEVVKVVLPRLMVYNRRRSGEIEALPLESYRKKTTKVDDVEEALLGELSTLEKHLLESQDLMWIRGKQAKPVPVLVPKDAQKALEYISDGKVRMRAGVKANSPYLFANRGHGVYIALQCLRDFCHEESLELIHPDRLTSTGYRAYMATIAQCVGLKSHEIKWICNHLGHTEDVHMTHYRHTLEGIERIQLGKLLLLQDKNMLKNYHGKSLDDIQFSEIVEKLDEETVQGPEPISSGIWTVPSSRPATELSSEPTKKLNKMSHPVRQKWTENEESELERLFANNFALMRCPNTAEIKAAVKLSGQKGGDIHLRKPDNIKKKVSNMIIKLRKK